ncbi:DNA phosphorothioation system sulfurtransferase DndC [Nibrella viscosa]|uniref:DNA phosphorothioation system sulfurtransferase DndC n=1 Tax=Nibrella viscosa TaxID=1084524 RepID=A0ABP8KQK3_9BACT
MSIKLPFIEAEIIDQYLYDENRRPWIIGFSGGKDSTMLLQVVWRALMKIPAETRDRHVYVVCNDTLVENPKIVAFINRTLDLLQKAATEQGMPISVHRTTPRLEDTFWVNLIGKGYPAPVNSFRWCTERLKINPTTRFIQEKISEAGEAIILLGTRSDESQTRARSMKRHERKGQRLRKHLLPNAFVYAPIKDIETNELWQYLMQVSPPWGGTHKELVTLYRNANSGDCPLVIDESTPSCGNSRFGCWVCTVVSRDKSMEGLIGNGDDWMEPLMELRNRLLEERSNRESREKRRRTDSPFKEEDENTWGPYTPKIRAEFLEMLLQAQKEIQETQGELMELITHQELVAIQLTWFRDSIFQPKVADIYNRIYNTNIDMTKHVEKLRQEEELLQQACAENPEHVELIQEMLTLQKNKALLMRKRGLQQDLEKRLENFIAKKHRGTIVYA